MLSKLLRLLGRRGASNPACEMFEPPRADMQAIERAFARMFSTDDGRLVLGHLQSVTFCRALPADASDAQLRYYEGQRALVALTRRLIERGRQA